MKRFAVLVLLAFDACVTLAAPVPNIPTPESEAQTNRKLRAYYDQLQQDLGNTSEGQKLRTEVNRTRATAETVVQIERQLSQARLESTQVAIAEAQTLEKCYQRLYRLPRSLREEELFQLSLWEERQRVKPRP
jgi:hypothetical protein